MTTLSPPTPAPIGAIVLDTAPLITASVSPTTLLNRSSTLYTTPAVIDEIRDANARQRFQTIWKPFITVRTPTTQALLKIRETAKKTGDWEVLSGTDLGILALALDVECEERAKCGAGLPGDAVKEEKVEATVEDKKEVSEATGTITEAITEAITENEFAEKKEEATTTTVDELTAQLDTTTLKEIDSEADAQASAAIEASLEEEATGLLPTEVVEEDEDDDADGWITPSNLHKHKAKEAQKVNAQLAAEEKLYSAIITSDFAMQNVVLKLKMNLLSPTTTQRIKKIKTFVLRCHACFFITRDMSKQFCPRCGSADTLIRTTSITKADGTFQVFLKKNFQYRVRGQVYSLPKPVHGTSNGKGPKNLILRADQKEYEREVTKMNRRKERDMMDPDYLPGILTGERRTHPGGRVTIGYGKVNPNARKGRRK
jgi:RNA-binding protein NOB1